MTPPDTGRFVLLTYSDRLLDYPHYTFPPEYSRTIVGCYRNGVWLDDTCTALNIEPDGWHELPDNSWINVKDRLPLEKDSSVTYRTITVLASNGIECKEMEFQAGSGGTIPWASWSMYGYFKGHEIIKWKPMPEVDL